MNLKSATEKTKHCLELKFVHNFLWINGISTNIGSTCLHGQNLLITLYAQTPTIQFVVQPIVQQIHTVLLICKDVFLWHRSSEMYYCFILEQD